MNELQAQPRNESGKKVKALRRAGFLPGVVYGGKMAAESITLNYRDFVKLFREVGESTLFKLNVDGEKNKTLDVLVQDVKYDPIKNVPVHVDFYAVSMDKPIRKKVPFEFVGESPAVKNDNGILVKIMHEIEIEALPKDLPPEISVGVSTLLNFESKVLVKDLVLPQGVKIFADPDEIVVLVEPPRSEEEIKSLGEAPTLVTEEVKTEREIKKAEEEKSGVVEEESTK